MEADWDGGPPPITQSTGDGLTFRTSEDLGYVFGKELECELACRLGKALLRKEMVTLESD